MKSRLSAALAAVMLAFALLGTTAAANADVVTLDQELAIALSGNVLTQSHASIPIRTNTATAAANRVILRISPSPFPQQNAG
jgi:hypothetical protein